MGAARESRPAWPGRCLEQEGVSGWTDIGDIYREGAGAEGLGAEGETRGPQESSLGHTHMGTQVGTHLGGCGCGQGEQRKAQRVAGKHRKGKLEEGAGWTPGCGHRTVRVWEPPHRRE